MTPLRRYYVLDDGRTKPDAQLLTVPPAELAADHLDGNTYLLRVEDRFVFAADTWSIELTDSLASAPPVEVLRGMAQTPGEAMTAADFRFCAHLSHRLADDTAVIIPAAFAGGASYVGGEGLHLQVIIKARRRACVRVRSWSALRSALGVGAGTAHVPGATQRRCTW